MTVRTVLGIMTIGVAFAVAAQPGPPPGRGPGGQGPPPGRGPAAQAEDREIFHYLLDHREQITRRVTEIPGGVETVTESEDPAVRAKIREHVHSMKARIEEGRPIRQRDPLFAEIFRHAGQITMRIEDTPRGVRVRETSDDPWVTTLIREHARVVDAFVARGREEARRDHPVPPRP